MSVVQVEKSEAQNYFDAKIEEISAYRAAKIVNEWLRGDGIEKVLPAQMFYNYTKAQIKKGKKSMIELNENNEITTKTIAEWYIKYLNKNFNQTPSFVS